VSAGPSDDPSTHVLKLLGGKWISAAISAAAALGVFDALLDEPRSCEALARALGCDEAMLARLLGVLEAERLLESDAKGALSVTALGAPLRRGALGELAVFSGAPFSWNPWSLLPEAIREGRAAFEMLHGAGLFDHLEAHPDEADVYHRAVDAFTRLEAIALAESFDFGGVSRMVDVGGGRGTLLVEVLRRHPHVRGALLEREAVAEEARKVFAREALAERAEVAIGSFLEGVPGDADLYVVKHVLHNWPDEDAVRILRHCRDALAPGGRVLVVEGLMLPPAYRDATRLLDLEMMTLLGPGRERTKPEFRKLLREAGLALESSRDLAGTTRLLVTSKLG
jgi:SAM-dependent methyltransferase